MIGYYFGVILSLATYMKHHALAVSYDNYKIVIMTVYIFLIGI